MYKVPNCNNNLIRDSIYCEDQVNNSNLSSKSLHDILENEPIVTLSIVFPCKKIFFLLSSSPNDAIFHYSITVCKINHFEIVHVTIRAHRRNNKAYTTQFGLNFIIMFIPFYIFI